MMKFRSKEVNDLPKATQLCGSKDGTQPALWALHCPGQARTTAPGACPALNREPQEEAARGRGSECLPDLAAPHLGQVGAATAARPSRRAALPACPRVASASCPPPSADARLFGKLAPNPPPSVSSASLGYLMVLLQTNLQVFKVTRVRGARRNVSFRHVLLKLKI